MDKKIQQQQHKNILIALAALVGTIGIVALLGQIFLSEEESVIQGQVEVSEYRISSKVPGRIYELKVREGDHVVKGKTVAVLEVPEVNAQEQSANAMAAVAAAVSTMTSKGARQEMVTAAYQQWQQAQAGLDVAKKSYDRINRLFNEGVVTAQKRDEVQAAYESAKALEQMAKSQYDMAKSGARTEEKEAAHQQMMAAKGNVDLVRSLQKESVQKALHDGEVTEIYPKEGELVGAGSPIMTIAMTDDIWGTFNVREDQLKGMKVGDKISVYVPAFDKEMEMKIHFVKDQGSYAVWKATKANRGYDLKTFEVKARPMEKIEGLRPGMSLILKR